MFYICLSFKNIEMRRIFFFILLVAMVSCDDGDFVIESLEFDDTDVEASCDDTTLYKISDNATEALIMEITSSSIDLFSLDTLTYTINNSTNKVLYRIFDDEVTDSYFCQNVPPTSPLVTEEWYAPSGTIIIVTTLEDDDLDGVPTANEGVVYNEDGTVNDAESRDTDGDGFPDYIDRDDDGDNVFTEDEIEIDSSTNVVTYTDTDGDGVVNYLDNDDDDDMVLTIDEDLNGDGNPANDETTIDGVSVKNYLTPAASTATTDVFGRKKNEYQSIYTSEIKIIDGFQLQNGDEEIKFDIDEYLFGTVENTITNTEE